MTDFSLVGDIGGTNSRFGLVKQGSMAIQHMEALRNDSFPSLEGAIQQYLRNREVASLSSAAIAVAAPVDREHISLTNYGWSFTNESLRLAAKARRLRLLNDYEALALSLPHLKGDDLVQIGGQESSVPRLKIVMGPGTGLGMAALAPLPQGGWMALPGELGQVTLPTVTREEFDLRERMKKPGSIFIAEDAVSGSGLHLIYRTLSPQGKLTTPEAVIQAALNGQDAVAAKTLEHFISWLARISGDAAMALQARGGVYLAGGIAPSIIDRLKSGPFRIIFEDKGKLSDIMRPIPVYVIVDKFPAFKGCAASLAQ
ncbi:MAG: glucokinase [Hyphomicrobiales bacterium]|nr:glucokinase [Hyphomicrobiales bacterium]